MGQQTRGYAHRVDLRADIADVWQSLIEPVRLARWYAPQARVDAREGGSFWMRVDADLTREAHIDVYQPPRRLRLIYMPLPGQPSEDTVIVDDFLLHSEVATAEKGGSLTILRLLGSGIPEGKQWDPLYLKLRNGWERGLLRLKVSLEPASEKKPAAGDKPPAAPKK
ncbi:MAG: SRPBCC domain-containing protein [Steroidobacterales bacterium]